MACCALPRRRGRSDRGRPGTSGLDHRRPSPADRRPQPGGRAGTGAHKSPAYLQVVNNAAPARWGVRNAYGTFLPSLNVSGGVGYTGSGESQFGAFFDQTSPFVSSNYQIGLQWRLDGRVLAGPSQQKALQRATTEDIEDAGVSLRADVTTQYLNVLAAVAGTEVAREQVKRNNEFLRLARARQQVGQATMLDVRQAEATRATSEVALLQAYQAENEAKLELFRRMGIAPPVPVQQIALTDSFPVAPPVYTRDELVRMAEEQNPSLKALKARETAARANVRAVRSDFFPRLTAQAGWSGFTQQFTDDNQLLTQQLRSARAGGGPVPVRESGPHRPESGRSGPGLLWPQRTWTRPAARSLPRRPNRSGMRTACSHSTFPGSRFRPRSPSRCRSSPGFSRHLQLAEARAEQQDADESVRAQGSWSAPTSRALPRPWAVPTRRSPPSLPGARRPGSSCGSLRTATGSASDRRSKYPTHRTRCRRPRETTSPPYTTTTAPSPRSKPRSAVPFASEEPACLGG